MRPFGDRFCLTLITDDAELAGAADRSGVDRIGVDFEVLGKAERQKGRGTRLSGHNLDDLARISKVVARAGLFVRLNPINANTATEIDTAIGFDAKILMLPFFHTAEEICAFVAAVRGRAQTAILLETASAVVRIRAILAIAGVDEVMIGLNDLRLQFGAANHFEVLGSPLVDFLSAEVRRSGRPVAIGGIGRVDDHRLPVPSDLVYAQYPRLSATGAWIARSFFHDLPPAWDFADAVRASRQRLTDWSTASVAALEGARDELVRHAGGWKPEGCVLPR
jgi:hypothetical protein